MTFPPRSIFFGEGMCVAGFFFFIRGNGVLSWHCLLGERTVQKNDELDKPGRLKCLPGLSSSFFIRKEERNFGYGHIWAFAKSLFRLKRHWFETGGIWNGKTISFDRRSYFKHAGALCAGCFLHYFCKVLLCGGVDLLPGCVSDATLFQIGLGTPASHLVQILMCVRLFLFLEHGERKLPQA